MIAHVFAHHSRYFRVAAQSREIDDNDSFLRRPAQLIRETDVHLVVPAQNSEALEKPRDFLGTTIPLWA
jgi:hypothetical protein